MCALPAKDWQRLQERIDRERGVHVQISEQDRRRAPGNAKGIPGLALPGVAFLHHVNGTSESANLAGSAVALSAPECDRGHQQQHAGRALRTGRKLHRT